MSKSLAELRASTRASLPERSYTLCLSQALVAEVQQLEEQRRDLILDAPVASGDDQDGPPRRAGQRSTPPGVAEIDARLEELYDEMREHTGELRLRAVPAGAWRLFVDAHPARENNKLDDDVAYGICDASALFADLSKYAVSWNDAPLGEGDWEFIENRAAAGDLKQICRVVVQMHEAVGAVPKSRSASSTTPPSESV